MSNSQNKNTYKDSAKGIAIFGGLQVYKILLSVVRTKCSAFFLGPAGFGIYSLISSTLTSIELGINCGLGTSAVKDIAASDGDNVEISKVYIILNRLVWITGLLAAILCLIAAKWLSIAAFGNADYTWMFIVGAISLLFNQLLSGQGALLSGLRRYKYITKLNIWTNTVGLIVTIVSYWLWGVKAIAIVIVATSVVNLCFSTYYARKIKLQHISISLKDTFSRGKSMIKMGVLISLSGALTMLAGYVIRIFISHSSDIVTVGLFTAVFSLVNTYLGLVFSSIEKDFFPRLSAVASDRTDFEVTIRQQNEILLHLLAPLITIFMVFAPLLISIFYSERFVSADGMLGITAWAMFYKIPSWTLSIGLLSKGDTRSYFATNMLYTIYGLLFNVLGFYFGGLEGLGFSYMATYLVFILHIYIVFNKKYDFTFGKDIWMILLSYSLLLLVTYLVSSHPSPILRYGVGCLLMIFVMLISGKELNKRLDIIGYIKRKTQR